MVASAQGVDVSSYQAPLTAAELKGLSFAFTRVSNWAPAMSVDADFDRNWATIHSAGLHRGAYWYMLPTQNPVKQAEFFVAAVKKAGLRPGDMLVCDSEELTADVDAVTKAFCAETAKLAGPHCPVLVYTNHNVGQHLLSCHAYPLWFAYPSGTAPGAQLLTPWRTWKFWQYEFGGGADGGDKDAFNGTHAELDSWIATYTRTPSVLRGDEDMPLLVNGPHGVTPIVVPAGAKVLAFAADEGQQGLSPAKLRVGLSDPWTVQDVEVSWNHSPVKVPVPAGAVRATVTRLDQGDVNVAYSFTS